MRFFGKKFPFSRQKFLMTFFSQVFRISPFFSQIFVSLLWQMSYMTLSSQEKHHFLLSSYFRAHPTTLLLKILGGRMHGSSPTSHFGGTVPPVLPRSPPLFIAILGGREIEYMKSWMTFLGGNVGPYMFKEERRGNAKLSKLYVILRNF